MEGVMWMKYSMEVEVYAECGWLGPRLTQAYLWSLHTAQCSLPHGATRSKRSKRC